MARSEADDQLGQLGEPHDLDNAETRNQLRILVLTSTYSRRQGDTLPRFVDNLCHYLKESGSEVHVVAPHAPGISTDEVINGIPVYRHRYWIERWQSLAYEGGILPSIKENPLRLFQVPGFVLSQLLLARKLLRINHYDVIHAHWIIPQGLVATLLKKSLRSTPPIVITSHGGDLFSLKGKMLTRLKKWIVGNADQLTVVSEAMKSLAVEQALVDDTATTVIPMGVDARDTFIPPPLGTERSGLLFVGRLVDKKGIEFLIQALPEVLGRLPSTHLTIIGDGPLAEPLVEEVAKLDLGDKVSFLGAKTNDEVPAYLQRAAVTAFPSVVTANGDQEGTPVAVMEALACGCAVVVSEYPGSREIIQNRANGLLVPQRSPGKLAEAIVELLGDPAKRLEYGQAGRSTVESRYDWRVVSSQFLETFGQLSAPAGAGKHHEN